MHFHYAVNTLHVSLFLHYQAIKISFDTKNSDRVLAITEADKAVLLESFAESMLLDKIQMLDQK